MTIEKIKELVLETYYKHNGFLTYKVLSEEVRVQSKVIIKYFGNLNKLHDILGLEIKRRTGNVYLCKKCGNKISRIQRENGKLEICIKCELLIKKEQRLEEVKKLVLEFYKKNNGYLTYREMYEIGVTQNDVEGFFGNLEGLHNRLGLEMKRCGEKKTVLCKKCSKELEISKYAQDEFERYCDDCKIIINNEQYNGLIKDYDYVECPACGFRAKSLEGHFRKECHTWKTCLFSLEEVKKKFGDFKIKCDKSDVVAKEKRRENGWFEDREKTIQKFSASGGHALGKTKENCEWVKRISDNKIEGYKKGELVSWNQGKTKENCDALVKIGKNISKAIQKLKDAGLYETPNKKDLTKDHLLKYVDKKGRICLSKAMIGLDVCHKTIMFYINKHGLECDKKENVFQGVVIAKLEKILDCKCETEKMFPDIRNKKCLRYDGYFGMYDLIVEIQGYQHYQYPNRFHRTLEQFQAYQERDRFKKQAILDKGLKFVEFYDNEDLSEQAIREKLKNIVF